MWLLMPSGCLSLVVLFGLLILFPIFLTQTMITALTKLGLSPEASLFTVLAIFLGGMINIPIKRIPREEQLEVQPFKLFGFDRMFPRPVRFRSYTIIAVNVGGCVVPCLIAAYELIRIAHEGPFALVVTIGSIVINTAICYRLVRPMPKAGLALPPFVPALVAAACGLFFIRELAPSIAFTSGVLGPLIGADLLHLRDVRRMHAGIASIGGAGTFDGIVLSGLVATLLA